MDNKPAPDPSDREVCLCFHVTLGKLERFACRHQVQVASQLADCHGAGTGCGWCVPHLERLCEQLKNGQTPSLDMTPEEYRARRLEYQRAKRPMMPPPADADGPIRLDLDALLDSLPDDLKLD